MTKPTEKSQADQPFPPIEEVAVAITEMARAMRKLNSSRLKRDAIVTLICHKSKVARKTIEIVLNNLEYMDRDYLKPLAEKK